jgi:hypothetical protein
MTAAPTDLLFAYVLVGLIAVGLPGIFFAIVFMPGLMRTTGETIGQSEYAIPDDDLATRHNHVQDHLQDQRMSTQRLKPQSSLSGSQARPHRRRSFENTP